MQWFIQPNKLNNKKDSDLFSEQQLADSFVLIFI